MMIMALLPGIPMIPFMLLGAAPVRLLCHEQSRSCVTVERKRFEAEKALRPTSRSERRSSSTISRSSSAMRFSAGQFADGPTALTEQIKALRRSARHRWVL